MVKAVADAVTGIQTEKTPTPTTDPVTARTTITQERQLKEANDALAIARNKLDSLQEGGTSRKRIAPEPARRELTAVAPPAVRRAAVMLSNQEVTALEDPDRFTVGDVDKLTWDKCMSMAENNVAMAKGIYKVLTDKTVTNEDAPSTGTPPIGAQAPAAKKKAAAPRVPAPTPDIEIPEGYDYLGTDKTTKALCGMWYAHEKTPQERQDWNLRFWYNIRHRIEKKNGRNVTLGPQGQNMFGNFIQSPACEDWYRRRVTAKEIFDKGMLNEDSDDNDAFDKWCVEGTNKTNPSILDHKAILAFTHQIKYLGPKKRQGESQIQPTTKQQHFAEFCADIESAADIAFSPHDWKNNSKVPQIVALQHYSATMRKLLRDAEQKQTITTWEDFKTWTRSHIDQTPYDEALNTLAALHRGAYRQRPGQQIPEFTANMRNALARAEISSEKERVQWYLQGLEPYISERLCRDPINGGPWLSFDRLATYADDMVANDASLRRNRQFNPAEKGVPRTSPHHYNNRSSDDGSRPGKRPGDDRHNRGDDKKDRDVRPKPRDDGYRHDRGSSGIGRGSAGSDRGPLDNPRWGPLHHLAWRPRVPGPRFNQDSRDGAHDQRRPFPPSRHTPESNHHRDIPLPPQGQKATGGVTPELLMKWNPELSAPDAQFLLKENRCCHCFKHIRDCQADRHNPTRCNKNGSNQQLNRDKLP